MNKQIEEMAKIMQKCYEKNGVLNFKWFAESAYKCLTEDSVILSKEEYESITKELVTEQRAKEIAQEYFGIVRKETAREIFQRLFEEHNAFNENDVIVVWQVKEVLTEIAKQYGVEIKE